MLFMHRSKVKFCNNGELFLIIRSLKLIRHNFVSKFDGESFWHFRYISFNVFGARKNDEKLNLENHFRVSL
jgi:hypothetical protein